MRNGRSQCSYVSGERDQEEEREEGETMMEGMNECNFHVHSIHVAENACPSLAPSYVIPSAHLICKVVAAMQTLLEAADRVDTAATPLPSLRNL